MDSGLQMFAVASDVATKQSALGFSSSLETPNESLIESACFESIFSSSIEQNKVTSRRNIGEPVK